MSPAPAPAPVRATVGGGHRRSEAQLAVRRQKRKAQLQQHGVRRGSSGGDGSSGRDGISGDSGGRAGAIDSDDTGVASAPQAPELKAKLTRARQLLAQVSHSKERDLKLAFKWGALRERRTSKER